jgi:hypothetical protein
MKEEELLDLIRARGEILQKDLWKLAGIDSRKCSKLIRKLEEKGMIQRRKTVSGGVVTFMITVSGEHDNSSRLPPCFGCGESGCDPFSCGILDAWIWTTGLKEH